MRSIHCSRSHQPCKEAHKWKCPPGITTDSYYSSAKLRFILASFSVFTSKVNLFPRNSFWINLLTLHIHKCFATLYPCFTLCKCYFSRIRSPKVWLTRYSLQQIFKWLRSFYKFQLLGAGLLVSYTQTLDFGPTRSWWTEQITDYLLQHWHFSFTLIQGV